MTISFLFGVFVLGGCRNLILVLPESFLEVLWKIGGLAIPLDLNVA